MAYQRKDVPGGWTWRDGRPRWIPSPSLRAAGWKGRDLRNAKGEWLERGGSIDAAQAIADAVAAWRAGGLVPVHMAASAPADATATPQAPGAPDPFSIGPLIDAYLISDELLKKPNGQPRPQSTVKDYTRKLKRLVDALAGFARLPDDAEREAAYPLAVAKIRAASVFYLEPVETPLGMDDPLLKAYRKLQQHAGTHMAFGVMSCASAWLAWCRKHKTRRITNWALDVQRETPPGRIRVWSWPEIAVMAAAADAAGRPEVADMIILGIDLGWSEIDLLNLTWAQVIQGEDNRWRATTARQKTGRVGGTPFLSLGRRRLEAIKARQQAMDAQPLKVIHLTRQRQHKGRRPEADGDYFRDLFAEVRAISAKDLPSCATLTFADTRDTGFSLGREAGFTDDMTASRSLQSRANVKALGDRSYGEIGPAIADQGAALLDAYVEAQLKKHKVTL